LLIRLDSVADGPSAASTLFALWPAPSPEKRFRPMKCAQVLSSLALRRLLCRPVGVGQASPPEDLSAAAGPYVARALRQANSKAWFALELALAGEKLRDVLRHAGERGRGLEDSLRFLFETAGIVPVEEAGAALAALHSADETGVLTSGVLDAAAALSEPESTHEWDEAKALVALADALEREGYPGLRPLIELRAHPSGAPLLVALIAGLFRHAVESAPDLYDDFVLLLKDDTECGVTGDFRNLALALARDGAWLEALLEEVSRVRHNGVAVSRPPTVQEPPADSGDASEHQRLGEQHARRGEYDLAIAEFTAALRADPGLAAAYAWRGDAMRLRGEYVPALADFDAALRLAPGDSRTLLNRGLTHSLTGQHPAAIADFTAAIEREPSAVAFNHRGSSRAASGDLAGAVADFTEALRFDASSPWAMYNRGEAYLAQREYMAAVGDFSNALRLNPLFTLGHVRRGDAYRLNGELDRAVADYSSALRLDPHNVPAFGHRGSAYRKKGRYDAALADFRAALQLDPENPRLYYQRGLTYRLKDEPQAALADFNTAARLGPADPEVFYQRGLTNDVLGRRGAALVDLTQTIALAPDHVAAFNSRGTLHFALGDNAAAETDLSEALRLDPGFALAYLNRALVRSKTGRYAEAVADCDEAIRQDSGLTAAYLVRGSAYAQTDQFQFAIADFGEVLGRDAENDQAFYLRGVARSKQGDFAGAQADLTEALRLDPSNARAYAYRGLSYQALKKSESAVTDFANAVRLDGKYAAAYCKQRAALHAARAEYEQAAADYSLVLLFDPTNEVAKTARDQALRALLTRPTPEPAPTPDPAPTPRVAAPPLQLADEPPSAQRIAPTPSSSPPRTKPKTRSKIRIPASESGMMAKASETGKAPSAPVTQALPALSAAPPECELELVDSSPDFDLAPANHSDSETEIDWGEGQEDPPPKSVVAPPAGSDSSSEMLMIGSNSEEEHSRQEQLEEQRLAEDSRIEQAAHLQRLAAERQRMLEEVKRKKSDIDRARRVAKRSKARDDNDSDGTPWTQWAIRAGVAALVLWGCFRVYDFIWGETISHASCYPCYGSVKFADGRPVTGGVLFLVQGDDEHEADIGMDGRFQTKTFSNTSFDGLPVGEYKVYLGPSPILPQSVPPQYLKGGQTPWVVSVKRQDNNVDLVVQ
jgi:tetratricopeptide (TPR) repeat protein